MFWDYLAGHQHWVEGGGGLESGTLSEGLYVEARRGRQAVPEVFNPRLRDRSCYLEVPTCYGWPIRPEHHQRWRLSVGANQTIDAFPDLKHLAKEDEVQARQHRVAISKENFEKLFSYYYSESYTNPRVLTQAVWFFTTCHFGLRSRKVDWETWRLLTSSFEFLFWFKGHEQLHSAAMKRGWWFFMPKNLGLIVDLCSLRDRENVCMTSRSCMKVQLARWHMQRFTCNISFLLNTFLPSLFLPLSSTISFSLSLSFVFSFSLSLSLFPSSSLPVSLSLSLSPSLFLPLSLSLSFYLSLSLSPSLFLTLSLSLSHSLSFFLSSPSPSHQVQSSLILFFTEQSQTPGTITYLSQSLFYQDFPQKKDLCEEKIPSVKDVEEGIQRLGSLTVYCFFL